MGENATARRWAGRGFAATLAAFYALALGLYLEAPTDFALLVPGPATDARAMVDPTEGYSSTDGHLFTTTVGAIPETSVLDLIEATFAPSASTVPTRALLAPGTTTKDYERTGAREMAESIANAQVAALEYGGIQAQLDGDGAEVVSLPDAGASGLQRGDVIVGVGDCQIRTSADVVRCLRALQSRHPVRLLLMRGSSLVAVEAPLSVDDEGEATLDLGTITVSPRVVAEKQFTIRAGSTIGPSAGLMMALAVLERLSGRSLTGEHSIAGTGSITPAGDVGPVGGVAQKVAGAEAVGAGFFLVPRENYQEAAAAARRIRVIPVDSLAEAVGFLQSLSR